MLNVAVQDLELLDSLDLRSTVRCNAKSMVREGAELDTLINECSLWMYRRVSDSTSASQIVGLGILTIAKSSCKPNGNAKFFQMQFWKMMPFDDIDERATTTATRGGYAIL